MELHIISPDGNKKFFMQWVELETEVGNFVIQPGHAPTLLTLIPNHDIIFLDKDGEQHSISIAYGIADITREKISIITND